jgi:hypothetical protein
MSSNAVAYQLEIIKATPGRIAKEALLRQLAAEYPELSKRIMIAVFDKNVTYGINKKMPEPRRRFQRREFTDSTWKLLGMLASRELSGDNAKAAVARELGKLSTPSRNLLIAILQQNLRSGFGVDVVNEIWGNIVETFDICLAHNYEDHKAKLDGRWPVWADVKYDGLRGFRYHSVPVVYSRAKLPLSCPDGLMQVMTSFLDDCVDYLGVGAGETELFLDFELVAVTGLFKDAMSNSRSSKKGAREGSMMIRVIDLLTVDELKAGKSYHPQHVRRQRLEHLLSLPEFARFNPLIQITEGRECADDAEVQVFFGESLEKGLEGLIVKPDDGYWIGGRSYDWLKKKAKSKVEGRIVGYKMADPLSKHAGLVGSVHLELPSGVRVYVAGMTDTMRLRVSAEQEELMDAVVELEYHELTPDGVPRHPRIKAIRDDK